MLAACCCCVQFCIRKVSTFTSLHLRRKHSLPTSKFSALLQPICSSPVSAHLLAAAVPAFTFIPVAGQLKSKQLRPVHVLHTPCIWHAIRALPLHVHCYQIILGFAIITKPVKCMQKNMSLKCKITNLPVLLC